MKFEDQQTYLGVTFAKRITWKNYISQAEAKARRKLNIMWKLTGTKRGANKKVLKTVYQGAVRPYFSISRVQLLDDSCQDLPSDLGQSAQSGLEHHHRLDEVNTNPQNGRCYRATSPNKKKRTKSPLTGQEVWVQEPPNEYHTPTNVLRQAEEIN